MEFGGRGGGWTGDEQRNAGTNESTVGLLYTEAGLLHAGCKHWSSIKYSADNRDEVEDSGWSTSRLISYLIQTEDAQYTKRRHTHELFAGG
jgi:hypothetical protein